MGYTTSSTNSRVPRTRRLTPSDEGGFSRSLAELLAFVRANGTRVDDEEIETSDVILPPSDTTLAEARSEFTGEGLIPD